MRILNNKNIYLLGFMGAGKTTVGKLLSKKINYSFVDLDSEIESNQNCKITVIFEKHGEKHFRKIETEVLIKYSKYINQVFSTGGGIVIKDENWEIMKNNGVTVYLKASIETLFNRLKHKTTRPLLNVDSPFERAKELFLSRKSFYEKADLIIDRERLGPEDVAEAIIKELAG